MVSLRLDIRHGRPLRLGKGDPRTQQQGAAAQIGERQHHVEVFAHVTVVQQVVPVQPEENARAFHVPFSLADACTNAGIHKP